MAIPSPGGPAAAGPSVARGDRGRPGPRTSVAVCGPEGGSVPEGKDVATCGQQRATGWTGERTVIIDRFGIEDRVAVVTGAGLGSAGASPSGWPRPGPTWCWPPGPSRTSRRWPTWSGPAVGGAGGPDRRHRPGRGRAAGGPGRRGVRRLDILVNNAGGAMPRAALDTSEGFMARTFAFNVTAPLTLTKLAARRMVDTAGRGAVVNISSRSASMTQTMFVAYGSAKAALDRMTRNIAPELAPRVRVNAIDVGGVATRSLDFVLTDETLRRQFVDGTPMGRPGEPEDIACAVLYLVSDASSWVTARCSRSTAGPRRRSSWSRPAPRADRGARATRYPHAPARGGPDDRALPRPAVRVGRGRQRPVVHGGARPRALHVRSRARLRGAAPPGRPGGVRAHRQGRRGRRPGGWPTPRPPGLRLARRRRAGAWRDTSPTSGSTIRVRSARTATRRCSCSTRTASPSSW